MPTPANEGLPAPPTAKDGRSRLRHRQCLRTRIDRELTRPMVWLALVFLAVMALALPHAFMALPEEVAEQAPDLRTGAVDAAADASPGAPDRWSVNRLTLVNSLAAVALLVLAAPFWAEAILRLAYIERGGGVPRPSRGRVAYIVCCALLPPLRTGLHPATMRGHMWLPLFGWRRTSHGLSRHVQRAFGVPMLGIGLLILPVLIAEIFLSRQVQASTGLALGIDIATRLIWLAFALEFTVMMAVTPRKAEYAIRHWVDVVIILLPSVAFLRALRVLRAAQLFRAQQVSRLARTIRLRGVAVKLFKGLLLLRVLEAISERAATRRIAGVREQIRIRRTEISELENEMRQLRQELAERKRNRRRAARARKSGAAESGSTSTAVGAAPHP